MNKPPILSIQMVPAGVDTVLRGLSKLTIEEAGALYNEIRGQADYQLQQLQKAAAQPASPAEAPKAKSVKAKKAEAAAAEGAPAPADDILS